MVSETAGANMPTGSAHASYTMAALLTAGGVMGYVKSKSVPSLVAGLSFAGIFAASGGMIDTGYCKYGHQLAFATSAALLGTMGPRFMKTRKVMPAGLLTGLGILSSAYQGKKSMEWMDSE